MDSQKQNNNRKICVFIVLALLVALPGASARAQPNVPEAIGAAISFQGQLYQGGAPTSGACDFQFSLWTAVSSGSQIGTTQNVLNLTVTRGLFLADNLDFGTGAFPGEPRWMAVAVRCPTGSGSYTALTPRLPVRPAPYALYANNTDLLDGLHSSSFLSASGGTLNGDLTVNGLGNFNLGGGKISISTPGGWPGMIMLAPNGHRRDLIVYNNALQLAISSTSAAPPGTNGITINESGYIGIGTDSPTSRLDVAGSLRTTGGATIGGETSISGLTHFYIPGGGEISMTTPGGWPGMIMYAPNGHRREMVIRDTVLQLLVSSSSSASPNESGININESGYVGIGTYNPQAQLDVAGMTRSKALTLTGGADLAEPFDIAGVEAIQPGYVVVIDENNPGQLRLTSQPYDRKVAGCVSGAGGLQPGLVMHDQGSAADGDFPVALSGRVYCWADASFGSIQPGDLLTTSATPGHAMLASDLTRAGGAILGKAMSALLEGQGLVLVLVTLQ